MKSIRLCMLLLLSVVFITSCKKPVPPQTKYIPKNAVFVATINTKSLQAKLMKNQATIENIIRSISGSDTTINKGKQEWEDIKASGVDMDENFYVAMVNKGGGMTGGSGTAVTTVIGALKDAGKLEAYIKKKDPASEVRKEKDYSYAAIHGNNMVAWGKDVVIMMSYQKSFSASNMQYDSTTGSYNLGTSPNATNDMKAEIAFNFNLKEDQSVASIPEFRDLMQEKSDASMWVNSSASMENLPIPLPKVKELFSSSFTAANVNFEDGKITMSSKSYYSAAFRDILKKYSGSTADLTLVENYPSDNINAFGIFSFNPELINELVKYLEVGGMVDSYLTKMMGSNYTLKEALKAIKGDFAVVVSDMATKTAADSMRGMGAGTLPDLKLIVNIPVGDKVQMSRLMDKLVEMQMLVKTNNQYRLTPTMQQIGYQVIVDDKNLFIASDENVLNQYKAKSKKANLNKAVMSDFKNKSGVAYVNIESILKGVNTSGNAQANAVLPKARETFKDMEMYTENFNGKFVEGHGELRFKNEKENSLTSLLSFIETASKNIKRGPAMVDNDNVQIDTVFAPGTGRRIEEGGDVQIDTATELAPSNATPAKRK
ncbi:DUF4836 family protein [Segetibacter sp.]|uniref:DUF4836 family protein n=1 Tax=Segetibacter sp. TaxID=2231182 RepID=UPI002607A1A0|nr:DUF4836 family protein [Segetibacter sp.]MCW3079111.1 hypothetical protein [Segetibacter sp.]